MKTAVKIVLINPKKKLLLQLRDNKPTIPFPEHWTFIGGRVEENEELLNALKREIKEEIAVEVRDIMPLGKIDLPEINEIIILFTGKIKESVNDIRLTEGQEVRYFDLHEIEKLKMPPKEKDFILMNKDKLLSAMG